MRQNAEQLAQTIDEAFKRIRAVETHALGIPFSPSTVSRKIVVNVKIPASANKPAGTWELQTGFFDIVGAGASVIVEGAVDAQMLQWDNTIGAPRREAWVDIVGVVATSHSEWPFGLARVTHSWRSAETAIAAGTGYHARAMMQMAGFNLARIYGGYLRVTVIQ